MRPANLPAPPLFRRPAGEYIDDTEDFINIELDFKRNRLIRIEILITTATFAIAFFNMVAGALGENLPIPEVRKCLIGLLRMVLSSITLPNVEQMSKPWICLVQHVELSFLSYLMYCRQST